MPFSGYFLVFFVVQAFFGGFLWYAYKSSSSTIFDFDLLKIFIFQRVIIVWISIRDLKIDYHETWDYDGEMGFSGVVDERLIII